MDAAGQTRIKTYDSRWKVAEDAIKKGLPESARKEVKKIYELAKTEKQEAQLIKAVIYMIDLQSENQENAAVLSIEELEKEISENQEPVKSILTSLLAKKYYQYYQTVRWQLYDRTATAGFKKTDIKTWTIEDFHTKISELYLQSVDQEKKLKQTSLESFDAIITKGNTRKLRPTLYDLLAHEALRYFSSDERNIKKPSYAFEINSASAFDPAADFIHRKFETKDTASLEYFTLILYQKLIAFHISDMQPDALIDTDLKRLQYVKEKSVHPDNGELYFQAINHIANQYQNTPSAAQAWYLTANWYHERGNQFNANQDTTNRFEKVKAVEICEKIIAQNPATEGGINAYNLLATIRQKSLQFSTENVNVPEKPFRMLVTYRNFDKLHLKLISATNDLKTTLNKGLTTETLQLLTSATSVRSWEQALPDTKDHQQHSAEIKVDALPIGEYIVLASAETEFNGKKSNIGARLLYVSNIGFVQKEDDFFILNRDTGQPLAKANVRIWNSNYDYSTRISRKQKGPLFVTDTHGYFHRQHEIKSDLNRQTNDLLEITYEKDRLFLQDPLYTNYYNYQEDDEPVEAIYLFTDRSLYRPGQTVYYKGIARKGNEILTDQKKEIDVVLFNKNNELVEKTTKTVNDYGSFSGSFKLPQNLLNGHFHIEADDEFTVDFYVEEYKRPKFSVEFDTLKNSYKINDTIKVTGSATAYAGNVIDGAKVTYRVVRNPRFVYPWLSKRWWFPRTTPMEITHGETVTDASGKFSVTFEAIPDRKIDRKLEPVFDYTIYTDVTDSNGETRSGETLVSIGYKSLLLKVNIPEKIAADSLKNLNIRVENMNGQFNTSEVEVKIVRLLPENRLIRKRYWERPDLFVMSKSEYINHFPYDEYDQETEWENWAENGLILEKTQKLSSGQKFEISETRFQPGFYKIEISTKDETNEEIKDIKYIELTDPNSNKTNRPQYLWTKESKPIEPGEKTTIEIASSADNIFVINSSTQKSINKNKPFSFFPLNNQKRIFDFSADEADRGGYQTDYLFVKHNRIYNYSETIQVPWTNKDLHIEYATFRDKTLPGSQEKWKVKITGYKKEKVTAEMLASMYDASLDQFYKHQWTEPNIWSPQTGLQNWNFYQNFAFYRALVSYTQIVDFKSFEKSYDELVGINDRHGITIHLSGRVNGVMAKSMAVSSPMMLEQNKNALSEVVVVGYGEQKKDEEAFDNTAPEYMLVPTQSLSVAQEEKSYSKKAEIPVRKNFNETAFFIPDLHTNEKGEIEFSFTMPEALTRWKFQALAHTKDLAFGYSSKEIVTQKDLMVQPNPPRFLREGDVMYFSAKVVNLTDRDLNGTVTFQLFDTETNEPVDVIFKNVTPNQTFSLKAKESKSVQFPVQVPVQFSKMLTWRIIAKSGTMSDGEENILPVLSNRILVTEALPLAMRGNGSKNFRFEKLVSSGNSKTLSSQSLTVEYTSNPAWFAVQALPYLMEYPYDCAEQTWNRYYANSIATYISNRSTRIAKVFETWRTEDTTALLSNLQKNQELKSVLLEETPWVLAAKTETQQKKNIALLFDLVRMGNELNASFDKLKQMQSANGGFVWFKGGPDDRYMTQYIVTGIGHLKKINALQNGQEDKINTILQTAIPYLDKRIKEDYDLLLKGKAVSKNYTPDAIIIQYLYMRSFFPEQRIPDASQKAYQYFRERAQLTWVSQSKYLQGLTALALHRTHDKNVPEAILKSLRETAVNNEETGMYWKNAQRGWWWHEAPIERQALLIEAFQEIENDAKTVDDMKTWLLKNKQTNSWESTKATAEACYALLLQGTEWLSEETVTTISLGEKSLKSTEQKQEAGTGYFKKTIEGDKINPEMGNIKVDVTSSAPSGLPGWGAVYWQYFEDMDKITFAETPLKLSKKLFVEKNTDNGPALTQVNEGDVLKIGDKIKVRIELRADRDMEYVHMKDLRASALEPVNVLSEYKWQGGLGYYETTKDASNNFFFSRLNKGTYVFEYAMFVTHDGDFGNGITSIQCMYAPEFTAHSEGVRVKVVDKR
ncbi:alpha-2-macroglobulin [Dyadobacter sp. NIV53]|uniref:alpha-2-macroglobulin family protein n=1 Tax=Dyadobacter sp. NIV53 TaxID=2861765 RepID=UPI001C887303|nr:alpha-2-macroglobulin family protein [Dyadobacter sp. NIV53]